MKVKTNPVYIYNIVSGTWHSEARNTEHPRWEILFFNRNVGYIIRH